MAQQRAWRFSDDRGQLAAAAARPSKVIAYIQAGATLWDHGIRVCGVFGSYHDGPEPDPAKAGELPLDSVEYLGAGGRVDLDSLLGSAPDLAVAVSYGSGQVYGLDPETAKHLEEQVPLIVLDVARARDLAALRARFAELARSLGAPGDPAAERRAHAASHRLRAAADVPSPPRVAALSAAGPDRVHIARPAAWPDLRALTAGGVQLVEPPGAAGANWATVSWAEAARLRPAIVLADVRCNATPSGELDATAADGWRRLRADAEVLPWNPEAPVSARAHARFLTRVADAVEAAAD
ncbi:ABC transporter substrate-binding protein [Streptomyces sp. HNM0663]|uniref:ABC transporter substrate-binding protein n=1 Tax=Streptomyces chengmaiensis TaxID=3040919 RepID=A0ABT6HNL6_9ACTN|nr:ABC transporter substrate-binding protein [Streptomyces chengmaiensis]MDH2390200.1 ABC transporter substrate-binding protein [Streptomyces chengmaiensis]